MCQYLIPFLIFIVSGSAMLIAQGAATGAAKASGPSTSSAAIMPDDLDDSFAGTATLSVRNSLVGNGLELEILNVMDHSWQTTFSRVIDDWDYGRPGLLNLTTSKITTNTTECKAVDGKILICSDDYGDTK